MCGLGAVSQFRGRYAQSLGHFRDALTIFEATGDRPGEAYARQAIGRVCLKSGDLAQASESLSRAMRLAQELGDAHREGCVCVQMGHLHRAISFHRHALDIFESLGDRHCRGVRAAEPGRLTGGQRRPHARLHRARTLAGDLPGAGRPQRGGVEHAAPRRAAPLGGAYRARARLPQARRRAARRPVRRLKDTMRRPVRRPKDGTRCGGRTW
ncbi:tetratricopeptide repeat protein [Nonomuraea salmonea]|uniref:tetratricopeptide repeat protein n=1 Tax=Nonomuraea salmonea TaxID=46181 RepID=UPI003CD074BE